MPDYVWDVMDGVDYEGHDNVSLHRSRESAYLAMEQIWIRVGGTWSVIDHTETQLTYACQERPACWVAIVRRELLD